MDVNEINTNATTEEEKVLQLKSSHVYRKSYETFMAWRSKNKIYSFSEDILLTYFKSLTFKPSSLWSEYSKLKSTLSVYNKTDISKYRNLLDWLKKKNDGFEAKKAKTFTQEELDRFITEAPDLDFLQIKVAVIFGIMGACGRQELQKLESQDVIDTQNTLIVKIMKAKKFDRTFAISGEYYDVCKKYMSLRPKCDNLRFFIRYSNGRCVNQNIGINKFGVMGKVVAKVLKLPNPELYTGHCFRRTSVTLFDDGDSLLKMRGWQMAVAEQCDETNRRTTRSSKIEDDNSLDSEKLGMTLPGPPAGPSKIIYVKTIDPNATTKDPLDPLNRRSQRCRFCFQFSEECIPISPNYLADDKTTLAFNNVQVQLDFADNFPNVVCKDCDVKLQIMYDFVKDVKAAQESLVNIEVEMESRREDTGIEMVTVKTEYEDNDENDSPDEDDNDNNYDSPDEDDNEDNDTKEGIIDSLAVGETNFTKQIITQKRKNTTGAETPKKAKVADYEYTEFVMDIKEEVIERNDTTDANNAGLTDTGTPGIDVTPCIEEFTKKSSVHTMRSDGNS